MYVNVKNKNVQNNVNTYVSSVSIFYSPAANTIEKLDI